MGQYSKPVSQFLPFCYLLTNFRQRMIQEVIVGVFVRAGGSIMESCNEVFPAVALVPQEVALESGIGSHVKHTITIATLAMYLIHITVLPTPNAFAPADVVN